MSQIELFNEHFFKHRSRGQIENTDALWKSLPINLKINIRANYGYNYMYLTCCFRLGYDMVGSVPKDYRICNYIPDTTRYKKLFNWNR